MATLQTKTPEEIQLPVHLQVKSSKKKNIGIRHSANRKIDTW